MPHVLGSLVVSGLRCTWPVHETGVGNFFERSTGGQISLSYSDVRDAACTCKETRNLNAIQGNDPENMKGGWCADSHWAFGRVTLRTFVVFVESKGIVRTV
jgi:hypothetical protein